METQSRTGWTPAGPSLPHLHQPDGRNWDNRLISWNSLLVYFGRQEGDNYQVIELQSETHTNGVKWRPRVWDHLIVVGERCLFVCSSWCQWYVTGGLACITEINTQTSYQNIFPYWSAEGGWQAGGVLTAVKSNSTGGCRKKLQYHGRFTCEKIPAASPGCTVKQYWYEGQLLTGAKYLLPSIKESAKWFQVGNKWEGGGEAN